MGRRSRKRGGSVTAERPRPAEPREPAHSPPRQQRPVRRKARLADAPQAPWHPVPLVELSIFAGLILVIVGIATDPGEPRATLLFGGLALISLASLELSIREHFAGYRSHTALLSASAAVAVVVPLYFTKLPQEALLVVALVVGIVAFRALRSIFERRAEGMSWRA
jgi:hypothetical protein